MSKLSRRLSVWSSTPTFPTAPAWGREPVVPASAGTWTPVIVRSVHGMELAVATDDGLIRLGVLTARDVATARDAGVTVLPGLIGAEAAIAADWGILTAQAVGRELAATRDAGTLGGWWRTETATAEDAGLTIPGAMTGHEIAVAEDTGRLVAAGRGTELGVTTDSGQGWFAVQIADGPTVTATGYVEIWPETRYIDVILLGGGGGGAGGSQGAPGWDGNGGNAGQYASFRWDRGPGRNTWQRLYISIGAGGAGGSRGSGTGGAGGATELWIDGPDGWAGEYLSAPGGAGGSGTSLGGGVSGAQNGKAPGDHSFQELTAQGGGQNGGTPGGGGKGGGGSVWPLQPGSGSGGARGQAWVRRSWG